MAAELPRPGVEVIQVFRSVSPTVITPTLVPCVVGVCKQIVDVTTTTASGGSALNPSALVPLPACFTAKAAVGTPPVYTTLDTKKLVLSINGPQVTVTFAGASLSPQQVVAQVLSALSAAGIFTATAQIIGAPATATQWRLRTLGADSLQSIQVLSNTDPEVLAAFGLAIGKQYVGSSTYAQERVTVGTLSFGDPNKNLAQVVVDPTSVRAFLFMGTGVLLNELLRDRSFLMNGEASPAVATGSVDMTSLTYGVAGTIDGESLIFTFDGAASPLTVTFSAPANLAAALAQINAVIGSFATATVNGSNHLVITDIKIGTASSIVVGAGTANTNVGLTATSHVGVTSAQAVANGGTSGVTPFVQLNNSNLSAAATAAVLTGTVSISGGVADGHTLILDDGSGPQTLFFLGANNSTNVLAQINALFGTAAGGELTATANGSVHLVLTHSLKGVESSITVVGGTALTELGLTVGTTRGGPFPVLAGDDLYMNNAFLGSIVQVAPGGLANTVKLDRQIPLNTDLGNSWYVIARNITASTTQVSRPTPDLVVDGVGNASIKNDLLRSALGDALTPATGKAQLYIAYHGVRQDVTAMAKSPGLLRFSDTTALGNQLSPISAGNPLALGLYFALLNAPGTQVTGLGVDAVTGNAPYGTVEAFTRAATFLEAFEVYGIAPLTHDPSVAQVFNTHVSVMSSPENKGERIALFNPSAPKRQVDTLVGSGITGNSLVTSNTFDTAAPNIDSLLLANGITPGALLVSQGVYLDVGDGNKYSISNVTGTVVTVKTSSFAPGDNDDLFYATTTLPASLINEPFAIRIRGAALTLLDGTPDKDGIALAYQKLAQGYANRRFWHIIPDSCAATLGGLEQVIEGFYMCAAVSGMIGQQPPQQSFTNFPMTGFTRVIGSSQFLTERQLNVAAAGGNYIIVQDDPGVPLISRMALTTDMTSIETRTDSITKVVDFCAKFLRRGLKNFIGRFNITQGFLDSLGHVIQGLLGFLAESGTLIGSHLNNIVQDTDAPDTVLVDITLDVPFPCNYIRLTLVI